MLGRLTRRMKRSPVLAFVLLSAVFSFGRTVSDEEIARAVLRAVRSHPGMDDGAAEYGIRAALKRASEKGFRALLLFFWE